MYNKDYKAVELNDSKKMILHVPSMNLIIQNSAHTDYAQLDIQMKDTANIEEKLLNRKNNKVEQLAGLILNTTEKCNLACEYCMVSKGTYNNDNEKKSMNLDDYKKAFEFMFLNYKYGTSFVCFFGGEPLLKFPIIKEAIEILFKMYDERGLNHPRCSIISNGVLLTDEVIEFLNTYNIYLSISIDGVAEFHDSARIFANGKGSYQIIKENLLRIKDKKFPLYAEATIHKKHIDYAMANEKEFGYQFVKSLYGLGFDAVYVFPVDSDDKELSLDTPEYQERMGEFFEGVYQYYMELMLKEDMQAAPPGHFIGVFGNIFMKRANHFCNVGRATVFVNPEGELYPCHLLYNAKFIKLGTTENGYNETYMEEQKTIQNRYVIPRCQNCTNRNLCFMWCPGSSMLSNGKIHSTVSTRCALVDTTVRFAIRTIYEMLQDKDKYNQFKVNLVKAAELYKDYNRL